jgi:hypothetical protein
MTGDHHGRTAARATLLVTATDEILGTHSSQRASPLVVAARKRTGRLALAQEHGEAGFGGQALPECVRGSPAGP